MYNPNTSRTELFPVCVRHVFLYAERHELPPDCVYCELAAGWSALT